MKRIGVSQRRDAIAGRDEVRDGLDVRLANLLWELGFLPVPLVSGVAEPAGYIAALGLDGFVLSGGNDLGQMPARDALEAAVLDHSISHCLPVFGICRGLQMMNYYLGGSLRKVTDHVAVRHRISGPLIGSSGREVNSYHNQGVLSSDLDEELEALAWSEDGVIEALRHRTRPWLGIMWHPERDERVSETDRFLIKKHLESA